MRACLRSIIRFSDMGAFASLGECLLAHSGIRRSRTRVRQHPAVPAAMRALGPARHALDGPGGAQSRTSRGGAGPRWRPRTNISPTAVETRATHGRAAVDFAHRARVGREPAALRRRAAARSSVAGGGARPSRSELGLKSLARNKSRSAPASRARPGSRRNRRAGPRGFLPWTTFAVAGRRSLGMRMRRNAHSGCVTAAACRCWRGWSPFRKRDPRAGSDGCDVVRDQPVDAGDSGEVLDEKASPRIPPAARVLARADRGSREP